VVYKHITSQEFYMRLIFSLSFIAALLMVCVGCGGGGGDNTPTGNTGPAKLVRPTEVPAPYGGMTSPFESAEDKAAAVKAGMNTFAGTCVTCHGTLGKGDGAAGKVLDPKPGDLTAADLQAMGDDYIFWRVTTGNTVDPFKSARSGMAPYESTFSEEQRWQLVEFIRTLDD
jgi:mono/diheme cytochrome c family protein